MEVRIAVTQVPKEITVDMGDDVDSDALVGEIGSAMKGGSDMLWFTDRRGRRVGVPIAKLAYVEIDSTGPVRRVGFSAV
ncbi:MAG: DUF3107 domain-containing protein [Pseudonocardiaceae bacterium]